VLPNAMPLQQLKLMHWPRLLFLKAVKPFLTAESTSSLTFTLMSSLIALTPRAVLAAHGVFSLNAR